MWLSARVRSAPRARRRHVISPAPRASSTGRASPLRRLQAAGIALWDVAGECVRPGSLDARIRADTVVPNDIPGLLDAHPGIRRICFNGATAEVLFRRHVLPAIPTPPEHVRLPSTSPAHTAAYPAKLAAWREALTD